MLVWALSLYSYIGIQQTTAGVTEDPEMSPTEPYTQETQDSLLVVIGTQTCVEGLQIWCI